jgi:hypothetical protein
MSPLLRKLVFENLTVPELSCLIAINVGDEMPKEFHTLHMDISSLGAPASSGNLSARQALQSGRCAGDVYFLGKRAGAPFPERIGVGRARTVDVQLPYVGISKYHAYFTADAIVDAGSKNGTWVDGRRLTPSEPAPVTDFSEIVLGQTRFGFMTPAGMRKLVAELRTK